MMWVLVTPKAGLTTFTRFAKIIADTQALMSHLSVSRSCLATIDGRTGSYGSKETI